MSNYGSFGAFELNSIVRGAQLTIVGANRALRNPGLFTSQHYKQAAWAVAAGVVIRILVAIPTIGTLVVIRFIGLFTDLEAVSWDEDVIEGVEFIKHSVLQVPFFLMSFMRYTSPAIDHIFMDSLQWVDSTYVQKHKSDDPSGLRAMYYPNLSMYGGKHVETKEKKYLYKAMQAFFMRFGRKAATSLVVYLLTFLPVVGRFVLPAASFYTFNGAVGLLPAVAVFGSSLLVPKGYVVLFLQSYFSSRSLMRELLEPYFSRVRYSSEQKRQWFKDREGVLYGFALAFFFMIRVPLLNVLIYGIAEASTAYLITKITEPPPPPSEAEQFKQRDVRWKNKHAFLSLPLNAMDKFNVLASKGQANRAATGDLKGRQFS